MFYRMIITALLLTVIVAQAEASLIWDASVGDVYTYSGSDDAGNSWLQDVSIVGTTFIDGHEYFEINQYNYHGEGGNQQLFMRSTETEVWFSTDISSIGGIIFQITDIDGVWQTGDTYNKYLGTETITLPYYGGATTEAYVVQHSKSISFDNNLSWYNYFIPELGMVREFDLWTSNAPKDTVLSNITHADPVPEPTTMLLLGTGLAGLVGYKRKLKN